MLIRGVGGMGRLSAAVSRGPLDLTFKAEYAYDRNMLQWAEPVDQLLFPFDLERLSLLKISPFQGLFEPSGVEAIVRERLKGAEKLHQRDSQDVDAGIAAPPILRPQMTRHHLSETVARRR